MQTSIARNCVRPDCGRPAMQTGKFRGILCATCSGVIEISPQANQEHDWGGLISGIMRNKDKIFSYGHMLVNVLDKLPTPRQDTLTEVIELENISDIPGVRLLEAPRVKRTRKTRKAEFPCRVFGCLEAGIATSGQKLCDTHKMYRKRRGNPGPKALKKLNDAYAKAHPNDPRVIDFAGEEA